MEINDSQQGFLARANIAASGIVKVASAVQDISIPVAAGNANGLMRVRGFIVGDSGAQRNMAFQVNGAATNVSWERIAAVSGLIVDGITDLIFYFNSSGAFFEFTFHTAKNLTGSGATKRAGVGLASSFQGPTWWSYALLYNDSTTDITSLDLHGPVANCIAAGSWIEYEEIRLP